MPGRLERKIDARDPDIHTPSPERYNIQSSFDASNRGAPFGKEVHWANRKVRPAVPGPGAYSPENNKQDTKIRMRFARVQPVAALTAIGKTPLGQGAGQVSQALAYQLLHGQLRQAVCIQDPARVRLRVLPPFCQCG